MGHTRRQLLLGAAAAAMTSAAGCLGASADTNSESPADSTRGTVQTSFFVLYDFAAHVAADVDVRNLVPFGQHGHGWEPGPNIQRDVLDADAFVYVGEGFQPWADKIVQNIRNDASDVTVIEAWHGIELLAATDARAESHDEHDSEERSGGDDHDDHEESADEDHGEHDDHEESADEDHDDHDHGAKDPHFWLDPDRAKQSVETIAEGFAEMDPANESAYMENAASFVEQLTALDETYEERLSARTKDTVLVAGHNSFRYLSRRYGFHVEALTGVAPDAEPTPNDVKRAQQIIDEHDIEYILAPVFESDRAAKQLVAETDAKAHLPLTPVPSLTEEWTEKEWGYIDVMENVNLPSLEQALGVE